MPVTVNRVESVQRLRVTGDPSVAGSVPSIVNEGDIILNESTGLSYTAQKGGGATLRANSVGQAIAFANGWI